MGGDKRVLTNNFLQYNMEKACSIFGLTIEQTQLLFSLQRLITDGDCSYTLANGDGFLAKSDAAQKKKLWLNRWDTSIANYLKKLSNKDLAPLRTDDEMRNLICNIKSETNIWKYMIFLECVLYRPYYPLSENKDDYKQFKGLNLNKEKRKEILYHICSLLAIDTKYIERFESAYSKSIKSLSGYLTKVAAAAGVGLILILIAIVTFQYQIIAFFAAEGLHGAAAISAGLAALGGGAVAAGGFGMAGGIAVLIGGGSLLGISAGGAVGISIASLGANAVLSEAAKMQVVLSEIVLAIQKDTKSFQEILFNIQRQNQKLKQELNLLKTETEKNKKQIKNLEKSIEYLEKLIKRNL